MPNSPRTRAYASVAARNARSTTRSNKRKRNSSNLISIAPNLQALYYLAANGGGLSEKQLAVISKLKAPAVLKRSTFRLTQVR